jgi:hypothetical protein
MKQKEGSSAKRKLIARIRLARKLKTSGTRRKKLQFSGQVASAESGTTACIICSEIFDED